MMRLFVKYDKQGKILAASKKEQLPEGQETPFVDPDPDCKVVEIKNTSATAGLMALEPDEIQKQYMVDTKKKSLKKIREQPG